MSTPDAVYATAFVTEYERRKREGITDNFTIGYPYRGVTGEEAWLEWCATLAHEYAQGVVARYIKAANKAWAKKDVWWRR